jgi:hypothetical protein
MNHQNQLEQMAKEAMFATAPGPDNFSAALAASGQ